jgi:choline dehydrogenase-like flavoprotein
MIPRLQLTSVGLKQPELRTASSTNNNYPRLSLCSTLIKPEYDIVIIGSGYGGGVAVSRMARAGKTVCVLERGAETWPGEYPHTFRDAMRGYAVSGRVFGKDISAGKASGLYHTVKGERQDVFLGCGLGGSSLINAGVFIRPEERLLRAREWPKEIREDPNGLGQCECPLSLTT